MFKNAEEIYAIISYILGGLSVGFGAMAGYCFFIILGTLFADADPRHASEVIWTYLIWFGIWLCSCSICGCCVILLRRGK